MAKAVGIGGVFLRTSDPEGLQNWYNTHLGLGLHQGVWMQHAGPTIVATFATDDSYFESDTPMMLNFRVDDLDGLIASLQHAGIEVTTDPKWDSEIGRFARIHDPEGNPIELWQPMGPAAL